MNETKRLAEYVAGLTFADLPEDVVRLSVTAVRDAIGVALYARHLEWSRIVASYAVEMTGEGRATVLATGTKATPALAAMANGTAVHGIEMDDRSAALDLHNGAATIPAALAAAEHVGAGGRQLLVGVVAGYEVAYRVARATQSTIAPRFYGSALRNTMGATAAASKIFGSDAGRIAQALGIAATFAAGSEAAHGHFVKRLQGGGWPAHNALTASLLSQRGLTASSTALEGDHGLIHAFSTSGEPRPEALVEGLGEVFEIRGWETKPYSAWGGSHTSLDAVRTLQSKHGLTPASIACIEVGVSDKNLPHVRQPWPGTIMEAQKHLQFLIAAQFVRDLRNPDSWTPDALHDPEIRRLADRITGGIDPVIQQNFLTDHDHGGARLTVTTVDGATIPVEVRYSTGTAQNPLSEEALREKFRLLAAKGLSADRVAALEAVLDRLPNSSEPLDLAPLIGAASG